MKVQIIHDWDYPFFGRKYALKRIFQLLKYLVWPKSSKEEYEREASAFIALEDLLGLDSMLYPRVQVLKQHRLAKALAAGVHFHPKEGDLIDDGSTYKVWKPGIGIGKEERWTEHNIRKRIVMDLPGRDKFTFDSEVLDVHIKPERQSLYDYVFLLAEAKARGVEFK